MREGNKKTRNVLKYLVRWKVVNQIQGAQRIPDPTTSGDFTRRFDQDSILALMEAINATRERVWKEQPRDFLSQAFIDTDGTMAPTLG